MRRIAFLACWLVSFVAARDGPSPARIRSPAGRRRNVTFLPTSDRHYERMGSELD